MFDTLYLHVIISHFQFLRKKMPQAEAFVRSLPSLQDSHGWIVELDLRALVWTPHSRTLHQLVSFQEATARSAKNAQVLSFLSQL